MELNLEEVLDYAPDAITVVDSDGKIVYANRQVRKVLGYEKEELIDKPLDMLIPEKFRHGHFAHLKKYFSKPTVREMGSGMELLALKKDGSEFYSEISLSPVRAGSKTYTTACIRDISEKKLLLTELTEKSENLRRLNKELEQYLFIASHDLQEPIRNVLSLIEILEKDYKEKLLAPADHYLELIHELSERMQMLVIDLLNYSRVGSEKKNRKIDCNAVLDDILADVSVQILNSKSEIYFGKLPEIRGNKMEIKQLFQNLITNAIKYRRAGVNPSIVISAQETTSSWIFTVSDNGIGIKEEYYEKIFGLFKRLHGREKYEGTGVGLALCKNIVASHKGKIWLESKEGEGSKFYFELPRR